MCVGLCGTARCGHGIEDRGLGGERHVGREINVRLLDKHS